jgi:bifunctional UDP-N-acetylglucosamine pyrophosphorylase/glucosamine-1-phosphate N-acetyltransferase
VPLIESSTLEGFTRFYEEDKTITFMTTDLDDPSGYGRVMMKGDTITEIIEDIEATEEQRKIKRVNTGICIIPEGMFHLIHLIRPTNIKGEYYLTDICKVAGERGIKIRGYNHMPPTDVLGINTRTDLLLANNIMQRRRSPSA